MFPFAVANHTQNGRSISLADLSPALESSNGNCTLSGAACSVAVTEGSRGMARVNIEERCFGDVRLFNLARRMGWDVAKTIGVMVFLWHDSQEMIQTECSVEDLLTYARVVPTEESQKFISALNASKYISRVGDDLYKIHGNAHQIDERVKKLTTAHKGGNATKERWRKLTENAVENTENKAETPSASPASLGVSAYPIQFNSIQPNSIQPNSVQENRGGTESDGSPSSPAKFSPDDMAIAKEWLEFACSVSPRLKKTLHAEKCAVEFRKIREIDKVPVEDIRKMLLFVRNSDFWKQNAASPMRLRQPSKKNDLMKHENIRADMNRPAGKKKPSKKLDDAYFANLSMEEDGSWTSETSKN